MLYKLLLVTLCSLPLQTIAQLSDVGIVAILLEEAQAAEERDDFDRLGEIEAQIYEILIRLYEQDHPDYQHVMELLRHAQG